MTNDKTEDLNQCMKECSERIKADSDTLRAALTEFCSLTKFDPHRVVTKSNPQELSISELIRCAEIINVIRR